MATLFSYIFCAFGLTELLLFFDGPLNVIGAFRNMMKKTGKGMEKLFSCPACMSSWVGIILSAIDFFLMGNSSFTPFNVLLGGTGCWWLVIPLDCFLTAGTTWVLYQLAEYLENNQPTIEYEEEEEEANENE